MDPVLEHFKDVDPKFKEALENLYRVIDAKIDPRFERSYEDGFFTFNVPLSLYPKGYHGTPGKPLPFFAIKVQKHFIALYHLGIYADPDLLNWFQDAYSNSVITKLNMGKSCIRLSNTKHMPYDLIAELMTKMDLDAWLKIYTDSLASKSDS